MYVTVGLEGKHFSNCFVLRPLFIVKVMESSKEPVCGLCLSVFFILGIKTKTFLEILIDSLKIINPLYMNTYYSTKKYVFERTLVRRVPLFSIFTNLFDARFNRRPRCSYPPLHTA